jgi:hypothetical protein
MANLNYEAFTGQNDGSSSGSAPAGHGSKVKTTKVPKVIRTAQTPHRDVTKALRIVSLVA